MFQLLTNFGYIDKIEKVPREIVNPNVQKDILWLEKQEGSMNFKFGVILAKAGQIMDDELFSNESGRYFLQSSFLTFFRALYSVLHIFVSFLSTLLTIIPHGIFLAQNSIKKEFSYVLCTIV